MSADELRARVRRRESKQRLQAGTGIALGIVMCIVFGFQAMFPGRAFHGSSISRIGLAVLALWSLWLTRQTHRYIWPRGVSGDAPTEVTAAGYRSELERWRDYNRNLWRKSGLTICFAGLALVIGPGVLAGIKEPRLLINFAPFFAILAVWIVLYRMIGRRKQRNLSAEIEALRRFEKM